MAFYIPAVPAELHARYIKAHSIGGLSRFLRTVQRAAYWHPLTMQTALGLKLPAYDKSDVELELTQYETHVLSECMKIAGFPAMLRDMNPLYLVLRNVHAHKINVCAVLEGTLAHATYFHHISRAERNLAMKNFEVAVLPPAVMAKLESDLADLRTAFELKDPKFSQHLRAIHGTIISYPESDALLDDDETALIIDALELHTKTEIVSATAKKATAAKTSRAKPSVNDL